MVGQVHEFRAVRDGDDRMPCAESADHLMDDGGGLVVQVSGGFVEQDDGSVGPIGGIRQKLVGAKRAGASYFLAPADNCDEVVGHVPDGLEVLKVATFDDGLAAAHGIAKGSVEGLPTCG